MVVRERRNVAKARRTDIATIDDVARLAGVSTATVSRVLRGTGGVQATLVERVRATCAALDYQPNRAARELAGGHSRSVGLWTPDIRNCFFMDLVSGALQAVQEHAYLITLSSWVDNATDNRLYAENLASAPLAGAIIIGTSDLDPALELIVRRRIPIVTIDHQPIDHESDLVNIDNVQAARDVVDHLAANGYRRLGIIVGPQSTFTGRHRLSGYRLALRDAGITWNPDLEFCGTYGEESGYAGTCKLLELPDPIDALIATSNGTSIGALRALHDRGLSVPGQLALVGFDEISWANPGTPSLTCIVQPGVAMGYTAADLLIRRLLHPSRHVRQEIILHHRLKIGDTSPPKDKASESVVTRLAAHRYAS